MQIAEYLLSIFNNTNRHHDPFFRRLLGVAGLVFVLFLFSISQVINGISFQNTLAGFVIGSIFALSKQHWIGLAFTCAAAMLACVTAWVGGNAIGYLAGALATTDGKGFRATGHGVNALYDLIYIIPVVLTLSLTISVVMKDLSAGDSRAFIAIIAVMAAGLFLGGYQIYEAVFSAVTNPKEANKFLVESLYFKKRGEGTVANIHERFLMVKRLCDCEILSYSAAYTRSVHLSIVAVVILETVRPNLYEMVFPQGGASLDQYGGVGQLVLRAQSLTANETIVGLLVCIWLFDLVMIIAVGSIIKWLWLRHYGDR